MCASGTAADMISLYTTKPGGIYNCKKVAAVAEAAGMACNVNGSIEMGVGNAANLHLIASTEAVTEASVLPVTNIQGKEQEQKLRSEGHYFRAKLSTPVLLIVAFLMLTGGFIGLFTSVPLMRSWWKNLTRESRRIIGWDSREMPSEEKRIREEVILKKMEEVVMPFYMRFSALDRPGVLSKISGILGKHDISIASVIQKGRRIKGGVPIVMMTHEAQEQGVRKALMEIDDLPIVGEKTRLIRVEDKAIRDANL
jgi:predicted amino acid-binding ACT domain protein